MNFLVFPTRLTTPQEKSSLGLSKRLAGAGQWRNATCKLLEEGDRCFLNIYVDVSLIGRLISRDSSHTRRPCTTGSHPLPDSLSPPTQPDRYPASRPFPILPQRLCRVILHRVGRSSPCVAVSKSSDTQPIPVVSVGHLHMWLNPYTSSSPIPTSARHGLPC
jgi:hypothetical protein